MGYTVIRIPYFIQMNKQVLYNLINLGDINLDDVTIDLITSSYKDGFIDNKAVRIKDFCFYRFD